MRAALRFLRECDANGVIERVAKVQVDLYGSLALTGVGHGTDRAVLLGLLGESPDTVKLDRIDGLLARVRGQHVLCVLGQKDVPFVESEDLRFHREQMYPDAGATTHPNGIRLTAFGADGTTLSENVYYSIGGGFILSRMEFGAKGEPNSRSVPLPFRSAAELLRVARENKLTIAQLMLTNEVALLSDHSITRRIDQRILSRSRGDASAWPTGILTPEEQIRAAILTLWHVMEKSIERGIETEGVLPGGLNVRRRAPGLAKRLDRGEDVDMRRDPLAPMDAVTLVAMAVNEENAAGGRVVTAPTNGAAGVIPAIGYFYLHYGSDGLSDEEKEAGLIRFFLTAAAIGILYKENASISGAEVGCQGEVGVACSMAAGGLVAALNGNNCAVEHAAEIGMEHNLGMTCDPIGGLVQIPCIERNGMGAVKAVNAARLAMNDSGTHKLSLDQIIETMYRTGLDMQSRYKETSLAGLALNIIEC